jgi:Holliday junction resolvase RusA-like endonuclease
MHNISEYLKFLLETYPAIRKATTKPLWEKWLDNRQAPTHKQMEKIIGLLPVLNVNKIAFRKAFFELAKKQERNGVHFHEFPVHPMACPRPRFTKYGRPYMPKKYMDWKGELVKMMEDKKHGLNHPIKMKLDFIFYSENKPWGPHHSKPDVDNLVKAFLDAAQDGGMLVDDSVVYSIHANKYWGPSPKITCTITY